MDETERSKIAEHDVNQCTESAQNPSHSVTLCSPRADGLPHDIGRTLDIEGVVEEAFYGILDSLGIDQENWSAETAQRYSRLQWDVELLLEGAEGLGCPVK